MSAMAIVLASSDTEAEDSPMTSYRCPAPAAVRQWGKKYIMDAMREHGFPARIAYTTAVGHCAEWMGLEGAPLLRAVWQAMERAEGPEFCASFDKIFGSPFWPLVHHLEGEDEVCHLKREDENSAILTSTPWVQTLTSTFQVQPHQTPYLLSELFLQKKMTLPNRHHRIQIPQ